MSIDEVNNNQAPQGDSLEHLAKQVRHSKLSAINPRLQSNRTRAEYVRGLMPQTRRTIAASGGNGSTVEKPAIQPLAQPGAHIPRRFRPRITARQQLPPSLMKDEAMYMNMYIPPRTFQEPKTRGYDPYR